jgi:hypothetical protein
MGMAITDNVITTIGIAGTTMAASTANPMIAHPMTAIPMTALRTIVSLMIINGNRITRQPNLIISTATTSTTNLDRLHLMAWELL